MDYEDDEDPLSRENYQAVDEDEEEEAPRKKSKNSDAEEREELVNEKRGYTTHERDMIDEWLKKYKPKTDTPEEEEQA